MNWPGGWRTEKTGRDRRVIYLCIDEKVILMLYVAGGAIKLKYYSTQKDPRIQDLPKEKCADRRVAKSLTA